MLDGELGKSFDDEYEAMLHAGMNPQQISGFISGPVEVYNALVQKLVGTYPNQNIHQ